MPNSLTFENDAAASLNGDIDFKAVPGILKQFKTALKPNGKLTLDLAKLTNGQTVILSLMLELKRLSQDKDTVLQFVSIPENLQGIAKLNGIDSFL